MADSVTSTGLCLLGAATVVSVRCQLRSCCLRYLALLAIHRNLRLSRYRPRLLLFVMIAVAMLVAVSLMLLLFLKPHQRCGFNGIKLKMVTKTHYTR